MSDLPVPEIIIFALVAMTYLAAAIVGILQLLAGGEKYRRFLSPLVLLAVALEALILIVRAIEIRAVPLTGFAMMAFFAGIYGFVSGMMGIAGGIGYLRRKWKPLRIWAANLQFINAPLGTAL